MKMYFKNKSTLLPSMKADVIYKKKFATQEFIDYHDLKTLSFK